MAYIMTNTEFIKKLKNVADNYKTAYVWGSFGSPITTSLINSKAKQYPDYYTSSKVNQLVRLVGKNYFGFDCVNLIKGVAWGWSGNSSKSNGGANYASNGVPDVSANSMITLCNNVSTNFANIVPGEAVWMSGHIGVYIGTVNGVPTVIESTPIWKNGVQYSILGNISTASGNKRNWTRHGKLPFINYTATTSTVTTPKTTNTKSTVTTTTAKSVALPTNITLRKGSTGNNVKILQIDLNNIIKAGLVVDGDFGNATLNAVKTFQRKYGLSADGIVGTNTINKINGIINPSNIKETLPNVTLRKGSTGNNVKILQRRLNTIIKAGLVVDGDFGNATLNAVKTFQRKYGLSADGIVGTNTISKINSL